MPWDAQSFSAHNHSLSPAQSLHAAHIANAILKRSGDEGLSVATANKLVHRDEGGMVPAGPVNPQQNVLEQSVIQRLTPMSPEQLQELIPRLGNSPIAQIAMHILQQKRAQQTPPMAAGGLIPSTHWRPHLPPGRDVFAHLATGGGMAPREVPQGMQSGANTVPILAAGGEFVVAPHHVARLGDGDVKEGHRRLDKWVVEARKHIVKTTRALKPPVRS